VKSPRSLTVLTAALALTLIAAVAGPALPASAQPAQPRKTASFHAPADVQALGTDLVDANTGQLLWTRGLHTPRPIGSIAKVMTALLVLQAGDLNRKIRVTRAARRYVRRDGASSAGLMLGDVLTARQLLEAMLVPSGCDAAYLLAAAYGPGRAVFVRKMNEEARLLDLGSTHFTSFDGMPYPTEHSTYSSPADLIRLGEAAMAYPLFRQIVRQRTYLIPGTPHHHRYFWQNTDLLLWSYKGAIGIKTGSTNAAGDCLLFEARRGSRTLIGVVLHADPTDSYYSRFVAATQMLNWGFRHF
jgi:serine-type D-Ala-D-Ala carboxypeptidase (penicillin-binding protein 5/6)